MTYTFVGTAAQVSAIALCTGRTAGFDLTDRILNEFFNDLLEFGKKDWVRFELSTLVFRLTRP